MDQGDINGARAACMEDPPKPNGKANLVREFTALGDDRYRLAVASLGIVLEVDRLRRERHELIGELCVRCALPGAKTVEGTLSVGDFNLSSVRARAERAKTLAERGRAPGIDWIGLVEEICQRVLQADRVGQPAVDLRTLPRPAPDDDLDIDGFRFPRRHPSIVFGDGGACKSYMTLYIAGKLARRGMRVAVFDWELAGEDHRDRLERLFGPNDMPQILYARCERPLAFEVDRLRRIVRESKLDFALFDSIAFACDGPPESAEIAGRYFRAVRQIGVGTLHVAHISKSEHADQKPFGSAFWHNGARSTWFAQRADDSPDGSVIRIGFFNRKSNLGPLRPPIGYTVTFTDDLTVFKRSDTADSPDLAATMSVRQRMAALLRRGALSPEAVAEEIDADVETVRRTVRRYRNLFVVIPDGRLGLLEKTA